MLRSGVGGAGEASRKLLTLERIRDRTTAKRAVTETAKEPVARRNEVKQHGYEDSEKNIEATVRSHSSAHRRGERMKRSEKSKANSRQKSKANSRQKSMANGRQDKSRANRMQEEHSQQQARQPKDCDRDEAKDVENSKVQGEAQYKAGLRQPVSPKASKNRCCPAGTGRSDHDHAKDRLHPDSLEAATQVQNNREGLSQRRRLHDDSQLSSTKTA